MNIYEKFLVLAATASLLCACYLIRPIRFAMTICLVSGTASFVGAKLLSVMLHPNAIQPLMGFALDGGIIFGFFSVIAIAQLLNLNSWLILDKLTISAVVGILILKTNCLVSGCCSGSASNVPWAISITEENNLLLNRFSVNNSIFSSTQKVHPAPIYEMLAVLVAMAISVVLFRKYRKHGVMALSFIAVLSLFRSTSIWWREPDLGAAITPQLISLGIGIFCTIALVQIFAKSDEILS